MIILRSYRKRVLGFLAFVLFLSLTPGSASAHRVMVFAWVEGDIVHVESKFSGGKKVKGGEIIVYDLKENQLLRGKTNEQGEFSFKVPKKTALKVVINAGTGHRGEWTVPIEEIEGMDAGKTEAALSHKTATGKSEKEKYSISTPNVSPDEIQKAVEKALDKKLKPVMKMLAESRERDITLRDVLGGIGYILGLVGVAGYFNYRRRKADSSAP